MKSFGIRVMIISLVFCFIISVPVSANSEINKKENIDLKPKSKKAYKGKYKKIKKFKYAKQNKYKPAKAKGVANRLAFRFFG